MYLTHNNDHMTPMHNDDESFTNQSSRILFSGVFPYTSCYFVSWQPMNRRYVCLQHEEFRNGPRSACWKIRDSVLQGRLNVVFVHASGNSGRQGRRTD